MTPTSLPDSLQAWEFLRRNPNYQADWKPMARDCGRSSDALGISIRLQTEGDLRAAEWGLLAYEAPGSSAAHASPFWSIGPTLEADVDNSSDAPLAPLLRRAGARMAGLRLLDGGLILRIERHEAAVQVSLPTGSTLGASCGLALRIPLDRHLPVLTARARALWDIVSNGQPKKATSVLRRTSTTSFSPLTA